VIDSWLVDVERHVINLEPRLEAAFAESLGEARFGYATIAPELANLSAGSRVLEIGAGTLLLSCALQAHGFSCTAVEPIGPGFTHLKRLKALVWEYAGRHECRPELLSVRAEDLTLASEVDFAFSINVMEHVENVSLVLRRVWSALRPGAVYQFVCPNYTFPFEPHFDIPTIFSKSLTERLFRRRILGSKIVLDPVGTWQSLNWISVGAVRRACRHELGVEPDFDRLACYRFVQRALNDAGFQRRHSVMLRALCTSLDTLGATTMLKWLPPGVQPALSCRVTRSR
jgi:SAM-dependent methyltransferase